METISLVAASDNHYAILLAALIKSIEVNHFTGEPIDFYIIEDHISERNKRKIIRSIDTGRINLLWKPVEEVIPDDIRIPVDHTAFPLTTYLRLFGPYIVPEQARKLIYLDVDTIVTTDISKLWHTDMGDFTMAAVQDLGKTVDCSWGGIPNFQQLGIPAKSKYFNSGVLLINPQKWREEDILRRVIRTMDENMKFVNFADQYGLNVVMANRWFELDPRWNWFAVNDCQDPWVIHFLDIKPIFRSYRSQEAFKTVFFRYLNQTEWAGFKPVSDFRRLIRKALIKIKKRFLLKDN